MQLNIQKIQNKLLENGLSQANVAEALGVSREAVSKWFRGDSNPRPAKVMNLARLLNLSFEDVYVRDLSAAPVVRFRKTGAAKTTADHIEKATDMGYLLRGLVKYLPFETLCHPAALIEPRLDQPYVAEAAKQLRNRMNLNSDVVDFTDIIGFFDDVHAVIVPVMWGKRQQHQNGLHIFLPDSGTTWVFLNLDSKIMDFKFWMAHELAHVKTPNLQGQAGEDFADMFASELLFPLSIAERFVEPLRRLPGPGAVVSRVQDIASEFVISPITVLSQINRAAELFGKEQLDINIHAATTNFNKQFHDVDEILFGTQRPTPANYLRICEETFQTPFFSALQQYVREQDKDASFVQRVMNIGFLDAKNLYKALLSDGA